ncbi:MAG: hypothetical protein ACLUMK_14460 [Christensenellales bacterium]
MVCAYALRHACGASLRLICPGMTVNLDGELIDCDDADFELLASALPVRIPGLPPRS